MRCSLCGTVLGKALTWVNANHAAGNNDFTSFSSRVMAHEVCRKCSAIDSTFEINIGARSIWLQRQIFNGRIAMSEVVYGASIYASSIGNKDIQSTPFVPNGLEKIGLRGV
jgi:hypothetical protein